MPLAVALRPFGFRRALRIRPGIRRFTLAYLASVGLAQGAAFYVSPTGADTNAGTEAAPLATLAAALSRSGNDDTILLRRGGVYREGGLTVSRRTLDAYGDSSQPAPALSGSKLVTNWSAVPEKPGVYQASINGGTPAQVYVNGRLMTLARYPNEGWLFQDADTGDDSIQDAALTSHPRNAAGRWVGGQVRWRKWSWWFETRPITAYDGTGRLTLGGRTSLSVNGDMTGCGYFIENLFEELDAPGEWWWNAATSTLYLQPPLGTDLAQASVEAAVLATGMTLQNGVTVRNLQIRDFTTTGVSIVSPVTFEDTLVERIGNTGLNLSWNSAPTVVRNCVVRDVLNKGIQVNQDPTRVGGTIIERNRIERIGMVPAYGGNSTQQAIGIDVSNGNGVLVQLNRMADIGYCGINTHSAFAPATPASGYVIRRNVIRRTMATLNDGAGIRLVNDYNRATENIILDTIGDLYSCQPWTPLGHGIWAEFVGHPQPNGSIIPYKGNVMDANTVYGSGGHGIFLTQQELCSVRENVLVSNWLAALHLSARTTWSADTAHAIHDNVFAIGARRWLPFPDATPQRLATWSRPKDFGLTYLTYENLNIDYGTMSGNTFVTPTGSEFLGRSSANTLQTLAQWQATEPDWADPAPRAVTGRAYLFINDTESTASVTPPPGIAWKRLDGAAAGSSVPMAPFRSTLLLADGGSELGLRPYYLVSEGIPSAAPAPANTLSNLSVLATLDAGETLIVGAVSSGSKPVLVRAAGPALAPFGVTGMANPQLELFAGNDLVKQNDNWPRSLGFVADAVGAFAFPSDSNDAAAFVAVDGSFSAQARGPGAGPVLVEAYDASNEAGARLVNLSARKRVHAGGTLVAGFAIAGVGEKRVLLRAAGPALGSLGLTGFLPDPKLELFNQAGASLAANDTWAPALAATFARLGAFPFPDGSHDAALLVTLPAGATYTARVSGAADQAGDALVEIYEVP